MDNFGTNIKETLPRSQMVDMNNSTSNDNACLSRVESERVKIIEHFI
jgi:hypothetical protein